MKINALYELYFSPTGGTKGIADLAADAISAKTGLDINSISFTLPKDREIIKNFSEGDLVVVAAPTYAGKLPNKILPDFKSKLVGNGAMAVAITTFGNRAFDNSLAELVKVLEDDGFGVVSAGSFVTRHSMAQTLGAGRPDAEDKAIIKKFAEDSIEKALGLDGAPEPLNVPGDADAPYYTPLNLNGTPAKFLPAKPITDVNKCVRCGLCARKCPVGSIDMTDVTKVTGPCIKCHSCVRKCTRGAKYFDDPSLESHKAYISQTFQEPKANCIIL